MPRAFGRRFTNLAINTGLFALNSLAIKFVSFFLIPFYTYYLTAAEYGISDMCMVVVSLVTPLTTVSIADAAVRFIIDRPEDGKKVAAISILISLASIVLVAALSPLLALDCFGGLGQYAVWFVLTYASNVMCNTAGEIARGKNLIKLMPICAGVSSTTSLLAALLCVGYFRLGLIGYFIATAMGPFTAFGVYMIKGRICSDVTEGICQLRTDRKLGRKIFKSMASYSLPMVPNSLFWWASSSMGRMFVTSMLGIGFSGLYAAASKIPNLLNAIYGVFLQAWQLSAFQESKEENLERFYSQVFLFLQAAMSLVCSGLIFISPWISTVLLQGELLSAWNMVGLLLLAALVNIYNSFYGTVYTTTMNTKHLMKTTMMGAVTSFLSLPLMIGMFGMFGACLSSIASQTVVLVLRACDSRKILNFEVNWFALVSSLVVISAQATASFYLGEGATVFSLIGFAVVCLMQLLVVFRFLKRRC